MESMTPGRESVLSRVWWPVMLAAVYLAMAVVVSPRGEFPSGNDWASAGAVKEVLGTGKVGAGSGPVFQVLWGTVFCLPWGFSFTALRISTLVMSFAGVLGFYGLLREYGFRRGACLVGALTLAANPLYVSMSYTFMTDVPTLTMMILAGFLYVRGLRRGGSGWLLAGSVCAGAGVLVSQMAVLVPAAFAAWVVGSGRSVERPVRRVVEIALIPAACMVVGVTWSGLHVTPGWLAGPGTVVREAPERVFYLMQYLGLFLLPLWAGLMPRIWKRLSNPTGLWVIVGWTAATSGGFWYLATRTGGIHMPYLRDTFTNLGLGAMTLRDTMMYGLPGPYQLPEGVWAAMTAFGALGAVMLGSVGTLYLMERPGGVFVLLPGRVEKAGRSRGIAPAGPWLGAGLLVGCALVAMEHVFDRHLVMLIPAGVLMVMVVMRGSRMAPGPVVTVLAVFMVFALMGVMDYMGWNTARWEAGVYATEELGCPSEEVDAGMEWGGWMNHEKQAKKAAEGETGNWWWVRQPRYVVTFRELPGYRVVRKFEYNTPFSRRPGEVLLSESVEEPGSVQE